MTATTTSAPPITHMLFFADATSLTRAISNGLVCAGTDTTLPMLCGIAFEFDGTLETRATDRYRLVIENVELDPGIKQDDQPPFRFLLPSEACKAALAFLKSNRRDKITLRWSPADDGQPWSDGEVQLQSFTSSVTCRALQATPPNARALIPDRSACVEVTEIAFTKNYLVDLGKIHGPNKVDQIRVGTYGEKKPIRVDYHDGPTVVLMPIKMNGDEGTVDAWGAV